jgi:carboxylesterase
MNKTVCVLIHGYGGSPEEVDYLEKYLKVNMRDDADVYSVLLAGHGGTKEDLNRTGRHDWINSAQNQIEAVKSGYEHVVIIGFSMGGLIGTHFAAKKSADKLVLINTPFYFWNIPVILRDVIALDVKPYLESIAKTSVKSNIEFVKILEETKKIFCEVECPVLIIQCEHDETVPPQSADEIHKRINGSATLKKYSGGRHRVFMECPGLRFEICKEIGDWIVT